MQNRTVNRIEEYLSYIVVICALLPSYAIAQDPSTAPLVQSNNIVPVGSFVLPSGTFGSTYGFGYAGTGGLGTYAVTYNPVNNSLFIGGHPYEQKIAEVRIPQILTGNPTATIIQNFADPLEGKLGSINPGDPNTKVLGSAFVYSNQLYIGAFSYYDGAGTQAKSQFVRPLSLSTTGQVSGPVKIGDKYPGWVDKYATVVPAEWQATFGGNVMVGGSGGSINSLQSWGPSLSVIKPENIGAINPVPSTLVVGYPYGNPLDPATTGNQLWSASDVISAALFAAGTRTVMFVGRHGLGNYCYGPGTSDQSLAGKPADGGVDNYCYDPSNGSKGTHNYPYRSQMWAYDANDFVAVKNGTKQSWTIRPYAVWQLDSAFVDIQGIGYDQTNQRIYVSASCKYGDCAPKIYVYQINNAGSVVSPQPPTNVKIK
jgi:hypothetical protein